MSALRFGILAAICFEAANCARISSAEDQSVVANVVSALSNYREEAISLSARGNVEYVEFPGDPAGRREEGSFVFRSGPDRRLISQKRTFFQTGSEPVRLQNDLMVFSDGSVLSCQAKLDDTLSQFSGFDSQLSLLYFSEKVAGTQEVDRESVVFNLGELELSIWWIGRTPLRLYLEGRPEIRLTPLEDNHTLIAAKGAYGDVVLEVGETEGWLPRKFRVEKRANHRLAKGTAKEWFTPKAKGPDPTDVNPEGEEPDETPSGAAKRSIVWEGTASQFSADSQGRWSPQRLDVKKMVTYYRKPPEVFVTHIDIESVEFSPVLLERDFETDLVFPANYEVTVEDAVHLPYKWDGKRPVPGVPARPQLERRTLVAVGGSRLIWLIGINLILLLGFIFMFSWLQRRNT